MKGITQWCSVLLVVTYIQIPVNLYICNVCVVRLCLILYFCVLLWVYYFMIDQYLKFLHKEHELADIRHQDHEALRLKSKFQSFNEWINLRFKIVTINIIRSNIVIAMHLIDDCKTTTVYNFLLNQKSFMILRLDFQVSCRT